MSTKVDYRKVLMTLKVDLSNAQWMATNFEKGTNGHAVWSSKREDYLAAIALVKEAIDKKN